MKSISTIIGVALLFLAGLCYFIDWYALVPAFTVLGIAIITRKALEPLIIGCTIGHARWIRRIFSGRERDDFSIEYV